MKKKKVLIIILINLFISFANSQQKEFLFFGSFKLEHSPKYSGLFRLEHLNDKHFLVIGPDKNHQCKFLIKRLTAPQQTKGISGIIFSNKVPSCQYKIQNKTINKFWNSLELIDLDYRLNSKGKIQGKIHLQSEKKSYLGKIH